MHGVLTTIMPNGMPQSSIIWVDYDGEHILVNTTLERQKGRNMQTNPKVTILVIDPQDSSRWIEVRGQVSEITQDGAEKHADRADPTLLSEQTIFLWRYLSSRAKAKRNPGHRKDSAGQNLPGCHFQMRVPLD